MHKLLAPFRFVSALIYSLACITMVLVYLQWVKPEKKVGIIRAWSRAFIKIVGIDLKCEGEIYPEHCLLLANHVSFLDIFALDSQKPGRFIAKSEIANWPIFGRIAKGVDTLFIERKNRRSIIEVNAQLSDALKAKQTVMLFPEGRTSPGLTLLPLKPNLIEPAVISNTPVQPVALCYLENGQKTTKASYANVSIFACLWTIVSTPGLALTVKFLPVIHPDGKNRHDVARLASASMSAAMGVKDPMLENEQQGLHN